jgi:pyruvate,water dikinase
MIAGHGENKWIYWLEELRAEHSHMVGKKCANLGELKKGGFPVPPGFAIGLVAYEKFLRETNARKKIEKYLKSFRSDPHDLSEAQKYEEAAKIMRDIVESETMPREFSDAILTYYDELCRRTGIKDIPVSVRSAGPSSHPGQYETYLFVRGRMDVMKNVAKVWSSTFNQRSLLARAQRGLPMDFDPIGVAVIKMVDAKSAGVMFTANPTSGDVSRIRIEGNWGLGESVVSGSVTPDEWMVDKVTLEISRREVREKGVEYLLDRNTGLCSYSCVPADRRDNPCLSDEEVVELAKTGKSIEQYFGTIQDIEWALDKGLAFPRNLFILQTRAGQVFGGTRQVIRGDSAIDVIAALWKPN